MRSTLPSRLLQHPNLRLMPWMLVLLLLVAQFASGAHKAQLDGHDSGQFCHACMLFDRDDAPVPASAGLPDVRRPMVVHVPVPDRAGTAATSVQLPESRAPPHRDS